jgi:hypothetical protein
MDMSRVMSLVIASLLVLASFASLSLVAPVGVASAAVPTLTLSPTSGNPAGPTSSVTKLTATTVTVTGSGFPPGQDNILLRIATSDTTPSATAGYPLTLTRPSIAGSSLTGGVKADANGWFKVQFSVPALAGGDYIVFAVYTESGETKISQTASFTITPAIKVVRTATEVAEGRYGHGVTIDVAGFGSGETVQIIPSDVFGTITITTNTTALTNQGTGSTTSAVNTTAGGSKTITALGLSSGKSATTTFTVKPAIALLSSTTVPSPLRSNIISVSSAAPTTLYVLGKGFGSSQSISANSITLTVAGQTIQTAHSSVTTGSDGSFGPIAVTVLSNLPMGVVTINIAGTDFNWSNDNILPANSNFPKGVLLSSTSRTTGTALAILEKDKFRVGDRLTVFGVGFDGTTSTTVTAVTYTSSATSPKTRTIADFDLYGASYVSGGAVTPDANGAWMARLKATAPLPPSPFGDANTLSVTSGTLTVPVLSVYIIPTVTIVSPAPSAITQRSTVDKSSTITISGSGFVPNEAVTVYLGTYAFPTTITPDSDGSFTNMNPGAIPDIASGIYDLKVAGTTDGNSDVARDSLRRVTQIDLRPYYGASSLSVTSGPAAVTTVVLQSPTTGIRGLKANTLYDVYFDDIKVASFTSTSEGRVPPGTQFTVPAGTTGDHVIDIRVSATGASDVYGRITSTSTQFVNLLFTLQVGFTATPSAGYVGDTVTITGSGLRANTDYTVQIAGITYTSFTSTAKGEVPPNVKITIPERPTKDELGTSITIDVVDSAGTTAGSASFILRAKATLDKTTATPGAVVTLRATGLNQTQTYNIIFDWSLPSGATMYSGTVVAGLIPNALGSGTAVFTVPADAEVGKTVTIMLLRPGDTTQTRLLTPPRLTIVAAVVPPTVSALTVTPAQPRTNQPITISATITPAAGATITSAKLYYKAVGATTYTELSMTAVGNVYSATIPAQTTAGTVEYYIQVEDSAANVVRVPPTGTNKITVTTPPPVTGTTAENKISETKLTNAVGTPLTAANVGSEVFLKAAVTNNDVTSHTRWVIIQIRGPDGAIISPGGIIKQQVTLPPGTAVTTLVNFTPRTAGTYTVEVFVFTDLAQPVSVAEKVTWTFTAA